MNPSDVLSLTREGLSVVLWVTLPLVVISAGTALLTAVFQTVTQIQDQSIGQSVTKVVSMVALMLLCTWQSREVLNFAQHAIQLVGQLP
jgi:type III secretion protein S